MLEQEFVADMKELQSLCNVSKNSLGDCKYICKCYGGFVNFELTELVKQAKFERKIKWIPYKVFEKGPLNTEMKGNYTPTNYYSCS